MRKLVSIASAVLLLSATAALAQNSSSVVPQTTSPQVTNSTVQGTQAPAKPMMDEKKADPAAGKAMPAPAPAPMGDKKN